jgi:hypothetical protein
MTQTAEKIGLFLPEGLHDQMLHAARRLNTRKNPRGCVRGAYERAFVQLADSLDAGVPVSFRATRGTKDRVSVRISARLCARVRGHLETQNLKLTDFAFAAIDRFLVAHKGP